MTPTRSGATSAPDFPSDVPNASVRAATIMKAASLCGVLGTRSDRAPRLLAALCNPTISLAEVAALVELDPALSLRVLRVANSAYYARSRSIGTIGRALSLLGLHSVRGIAATACLDRVLTVGASSTKDIKAVMYHSMATATAAESLARVSHPAQAADAFIAGLLHNAGTIVQMHLDTPGVQTLMQQPGDGPLDIRQLEADHGIIGHEECGAVIFAAWNLPEPLVVATGHHHGPLEEAPHAHRDLVAYIQVGASLALACGYTFSLEPAATPGDPAAVAQLGLDDDQIAAVAATVPERVAALDDALFGA